MCEKCTLETDNRCSNGGSECATPLSCCYGSAKSELIRIASNLLQLVPSGMVDDYPQKTYSASRVAQMMEKPQEAAKMLAYQLRQIADSLKG